MPAKEAKPILLDTDVIINWLTRETESVSQKPLWDAPFKIISRIERGDVKGFISLTSLLEIRFFLRRKKKVSEHQVNADIDKLSGMFDILVPDEIELLRANKLQSKYPLDPFDAITLSLALGIANVILISRDIQFLKNASTLVETGMPEEILNRI